MAAWYIDMCVNLPLPTTSPIAHTPGAARMCPSTGTACWDSSIPMLPTPTAARSARRPVATSSALPLTSPPQASVSVNPAAGPGPGSWLTCPAFTPARTSMPSRRNTSAISWPASGSSVGSSRPLSSTMVTLAPKRE